MKSFIRLIIVIISLTSAGKCSDERLQATTEEISQYDVSSLEQVFSWVAALKKAGATKVFVALDLDSTLLYNIWDHFDSKQSVNRLYPGTIHPSILYQQLLKKFREIAPHLSHEIIISLFQEAILIHPETTKILAKLKMEHDAEVFALTARVSPTQAIRDTTHRQLDFHGVDFKSLSTHTIPPIDGAFHDNGVVFAEDKGRVLKHYVETYCTDNGLEPAKVVAILVDDQQPNIDDAIAAFDGSKISFLPLLFYNIPEATPEDPHKFLADIFQEVLRVHGPTETAE